MTLWGMYLVPTQVLQKKFRKKNHFQDTQEEKLLYLQN